MRLLYLTQHYPPESQAAAFRAYETAEKLAAKGMEIHLITGFPNLRAEREVVTYRRKLIIKERIGQINVTRVYTPLDTKAGAWIRLLSYTSYMFLAFITGLFLPKPAVIFASTPPLFVALPGWALSRLKRASYLLEIRDLWVDFAVILGQLKQGWMVSFSRKVEKLVTEAACKIIVVTKGYKKLLIDRGIDPEKIQIVYGGVDFSNPIYFEKKNSLAIKQLYQLDGKFVVGYAGNVGLAQGLGVIVEAAARLKNEPDIVFILVGDGADKERLVDLSKERNLSNIIFTGQIPREQAARYIDSFNCALVALIDHPLFNITLPSKIFECMAFRKPVLLGLGGEAKEIIERSGAGLLFDVNEPQTLVESVKYLKNNPAEINRMGDKGYRFAREHFDRERLVDQLSELLFKYGQSQC